MSDEKRGSLDRGSKSLLLLAKRIKSAAQKVYPTGTRIRYRIPYRRKAEFEGQVGSVRFDQHNGGVVLFCSRLPFTRSAYTQGIDYVALSSVIEIISTPETAQPAA